MKTLNNKILLIIPILALGVGCSYFAKNKEKITYQINESARQNNSAAYIAAQKTEEKILETKVNIENTNWLGAKLSIYGAEISSSITSQFLRRNENLLGKPIIDQEKTIENLLSTNNTVRNAEIKRQSIKENEETELRAKIQELENKLINYGQQFEEERNKSIVKKTWTWLISSIGISGVVALLIFFPFLIPLATQILAKIVSLVPSLAHSLGILSKKVMTNTMTAISNAREELKKEKELAPDKKYTPAEVLVLLDTNLKIALDKDDKKLVQSFRDKLNL